MKRTSDNVQGMQEGAEENFSSLFGVEKLPEPVLLAIVEHEDYARNLMLVREYPEMLNSLLQNPPAVSEKNTLDFDNVELIGKAVKAFTNWARQGFSIVSASVLEQRENACLSCEHLGKPEKFLQRMVTGTSKNNIGSRAADCVCKLCGCSVSKKIRFASESCPCAHPTDKNLSRWGEELVSVQ